MYNYIAFRVYEHFELRYGKTIGLSNTKGFLTILQITLIVTLSVIIEVIFNISFKELIGNIENIEYYIGIPMTVILYKINNVLINNRFEGSNFQKIKFQYYKSKYKMPMGLILLSPVFFLVGVPIIIAAIRNTWLLT